VQRGKRKWYVAILLLLVGGLLLWSQQERGEPSLQSAASNPGVVPAAQRAAAPSNARVDDGAVATLVPARERFSVRGWDVGAARQDRTGVDSELHLFDASARQQALEAAGRTSGEIEGSTIVIQTGASARSRLSWAETAEVGGAPLTSRAEVLGQPAEVISIVDDYHVVVWRDGDGAIVTAAVEGLTRRELDRTVLEQIVRVTDREFSTWLEDPVSESGAERNGGQG
jgi:hypothetical protein